jgi:hypothetical protein
MATQKRKLLFCVGCEAEATHCTVDDLDPTHCFDCSKPGMVDPTYEGRFCRRCKKVNKNFGPPGQSATHCGTCKDLHHVDVRNWTCVECGKSACYGLPDQPRATHCAKHKQPDQVNVKTKHCNCGSGKKPSFGNAEDRKAVRCKSCKLELDVNVVSKMCEDCEEKQPSFALPGEGPRYCLTCAKKYEGMVNVKINKKTDPEVPVVPVVPVVSVVPEVCVVPEPCAKCSNCSRGQQPLSEFLDDKGVQRKTCRKCRDKGKRLDHKRVEDPDGVRATYKQEYARENRPDIKYRQKKRAEDEESYLARNAEVHRRWHGANRDHVAEWSRNNLNRRWSSIVLSAEKRGLSLDITVEEFETLAVQPCFYCGERDPDFPFFGMDRLDNSKGYTMDNVVTCCEPCNTMKTCLDPITLLDRVEDVLFAQDHKQESTAHPESWYNSRAAPMWSRYTTRMTMKPTMTHALTEVEFNHLIQQPCFFCLSTSRFRGIDRLDNDRGYTITNVVPACSACNYLKNDLSLDIFFRKCRLMLARKETIKTKISTMSIRRCLFPIQKRHQ